MQTQHPVPTQELERRKLAAGSLLRWMDDEITHAPEEYIRSLEENIALSVCRGALEKAASKGDKVSASVLCSLDATRLNKLHLATVHDAANPDGRKNASESTVQASKFLNLEHMLIANDLVQYTVAPDTTRIGVQSRHDRGNAARYVMDIIDEMGSN